MRRVTTGSVILYVKATRTADEDLYILRYAAKNPSFPNQKIGDQFFDEAQWESYRALGEHIGNLLFYFAGTLWFRGVLDVLPDEAADALPDASY